MSISATVAVLMPAWNAAPWIEAAIRSTWNQSLSPSHYALYLLNDGSTDETDALIRALLASRAPGALPMTAYASLPDHLGVARRLNELRAMALTPLLARMDADDVMSPTRLAEQVAFLTATPEVGVLGGWAETFLDGPDGDVVVAIDRPPTDHESIVRALKTRNPLIHGTVMARRDVFSLVGGYDESLQAAQDYDLWTRLAPHVRFRNLPTVLIRRRLHPTQVSQHRRRERWRVEAMARLRGGATPYKQLAGLLFKR